MDERGKYARMFAAADLAALSDAELINRSDLSLMLKIEPRESVMDGQALAVFDSIVQTYSKGRATRVDIFDVQKPTFLAPMNFDARKAFIEKYRALCDIQIFKDVPGGENEVPFGVAVH